MASLGDLVVNLNANTSGFNRRLRSSRQLVASTTKAMSANFASVGRSVASMVTGFAALSAMKTVLDTTVSFSDAMLSVKAVTGAAEADFAMLTNTSKELGRTTSFTSVEVANLMTELGRAGFSPASINEMTSSVMNLSRATGTEAAQAAGIMGATLRQFGLDASAAARVSDVLTTAANKSFNTVEQLGEALTYAGPVAADLGLSLEDTVAVLGVLGNVGIQASSAGTAIRRMGIISAAEADKLQNIFGVSFRDSAGQALPLVEMLDQIGQATAGLSTDGRVSKMNEAFGLLGITAASALSKSVGSVTELKTALTDSAGSAQKAAAMMDSGIGGSMRRLGSAVEGVVLSIGDRLAPSFSQLADFASNNLTFVSDSFASVQDAITRGITVAMAVGEFAMTNWKEIGVLAFTSVKLAAVQFGATVAHFFTSTLPTVLNWFGDNWQSVFLTAFDFVATGFINLGKNIRNVWSSILDFIKGNTSSLAFTWTPLLDGFKNTISELPDIPPRAIGELEKQLQADVSRLGDSVGKSLADSVGGRLATLAEMQNKVATLVPPERPDITQPSLGGQGGGQSSGARSGDVDFAGAMQKGSEEAMKAIIMASRSSPELTEAKKQTGHLKTLSEWAKRQQARTDKLELKRQGAV